MIYAPLPPSTKGTVWSADERIVVEPYSAIPFDTFHAPGGSKYRSFNDAHSVGEHPLQGKLDGVAKSCTATCHNGQLLLGDKERDTMQHDGNGNMRNMTESRKKPLKSTLRVARQEFFVASLIILVTERYPG